MNKRARNKEEQQEHIYNLIRTCPHISAIANANKAEFRNLHVLVDLLELACSMDNGTRVRTMQNPLYLKDIVRAGRYQLWQHTGLTPHSETPRSSARGCGRS